MLNSNKPRRHFALTAALAFGLGCSFVLSEPAPAAAQDVPPFPPAFDNVVTLEWLSEHLEDPDLVILDCTVMVERNKDGSVNIVSGRANYERGHIYRCQEKLSKFCSAGPP